MCELTLEGKKQEIQRKNHRLFNSHRSVKYYIPGMSIIDR
jgi:hypothetical protein